uniref:Secreted protein n=1 Tax=Schistocephalus solidus TaxID=70667 RepID=A0A183TQL5_SCHSO
LLRLQRRASLCTLWKRQVWVPVSSAVCKTGSLMLAPWTRRQPPQMHAISWPRATWPALWTLLCVYACMTSSKRSSSLYPTVKVRPFIPDHLLSVKTIGTLSWSVDLSQAFEPPMLSTKWGNL